MAVDRDSRLPLTFLDRSSLPEDLCSLSLGLFPYIFSALTLKQVYFFLTLLLRKAELKADAKAGGRDCCSAFRASEMEVGDSKSSKDDPDE